MQIEILVNGAPRKVEEGLSIADLVRDLGLTPEQVAVELNRKLVPRGAHAATPLAAGDALEVVTLVGGG